MHHRRSTLSRRGTMRGSGRRDDAAAGIVVMDIGSVWTKIGVTGDVAVRCVTSTNSDLRSVMHCCRDEETIARCLFPWLAECALRVPELMVGDYSAVILVNPSINPLFMQLLQKWLHATTGHIPQCLNTQLAALAGFGLTHGIVVDVGYFSTRVCGITGGVVSYPSVVVSSIGWRFVLERLRTSLIAENAVLSDGLIPSALLTDDILNSFLKCFGVVSPDVLLDADGMQYPLPLKTVVLSGKPCVALEKLFSSEDDEALTVPRAVQQCASLFDGVPALSLCLTGGPVALPNFCVRLARELTKLQLSLTVHYKASASSSILTPILGGLSLQGLQ